MDQPIEQGAGLLHVLQTSAGSSQRQLTRLGADGRVELNTKNPVRHVVSLSDLYLSPGIGYLGSCISASRTRDRSQEQDPFVKSRFP
jgi:hypothetical protein